MRSIITKSLEVISYIGIVVIILGGAISGSQAGGAMGFISGLIGGFVFSVVVFGALFLLMDIADNTRRAADAQERNG